jgi:hypothetical protein
VPETDTEFTVTDGPPDKVSVNDCVALEPIVTLPKLNVLVLTVNLALWDPFAARA